MTPTLVKAITVDHGRRCLVFMQDDIGPFVETRPGDEDIDTFLAGHALALEASMVAAADQPSDEDQFRQQIAETDPAIVKAVFRIDDTQLAEAISIKGGK